MILLMIIMIIIWHDHDDFDDRHHDFVDDHHDYFDDHHDLHDCHHDFPDYQHVDDILFSII